MDLLRNAAWILYVAQVQARLDRVSGPHPPAPIPRGARLFLEEALRAPPKRSPWILPLYFIKNNFGTEIVGNLIFSLNSLGGTHRAFPTPSFLALNGFNTLALFA